MPEVYFKAIIKQLKTIKAAGIVIGIAVVFAFAVLLFYNPVPKKSVVEDKNKALEELRQAEIKLTNAKLDSIRLDQRMQNEFYEKRESELSDRLKQNTEALKKNRDENKVVDRSDYSSVQLQRAVADVVRQYKAGQ